MLHPSHRNDIRVLINGKLNIVQGDDMFLSLSDYLRLRLNLKGTKVVCAEGDCGACTNLVSKFNGNNWEQFKSLNSCITPLYLLDLSSIVTIEGMGTNEGPSDLQLQMIKNHGSQCGFCTPGVVCSLSGLTEESFSVGEELTEKKIKNHLTGNLCRCTGYEPIIQSALRTDPKKWTSLQSRYQPAEYFHDFKIQFSKPLCLVGNFGTIFIPKSLDEALKLKNQNPLYRLMAGGTDIGVQKNKGKLQNEEIIVLSYICELNLIKKSDDSIWIGGAVTLSDLEKNISDSHSEFSDLLNIFASPQIKNRGTLVGNVLNGSPIGDSIPPLFAYGAQVELRSVQGTRLVAIESFYTSYKKMDARPNEIATAIILPRMNHHWRTKFYKVSVRKDLDISNVTFAAALRIEDNLITDVRIAMGGVGPIVSRLNNVENILIGNKFEHSIFKKAGELAAQSITPIDDLRASRAYRLQVTKNLFEKCFHELRGEARI